MRKFLLIVVLLLCIAQPALAATSTVTLIEVDGQVQVTGHNPQINVGDTVTWDNRGEQERRLRIGGHPNAQVGAHDSKTIEFKKAGKFNYVFGGDSGTVTVAATNSETTDPASSSPTNSTTSAGSTSWGSSTNKPDLLAPADFERRDLRISREASLEKFLLRAILFFLGFLGILMLIMMVLGGYRILIDRGTEEKYTQGKTILTNAIIGFVVIILSYAIINELLSSTSILRSIFSILG